MEGEGGCAITATATAPGYKPWKKTVRITSGGKHTVEIVLEKE